MKLIRPDKKYIEKILGMYREENFYETDGALGLIFKNYPKNDNIHQILVKVALVNQLYRTNIFSPYTVAKHIFNLRPVVDKELLLGSHEIIDKIASVKFEHRTICFYSFATKYCSWHRPEQYFIYDSYVEWLIWEYRKEYKFCDYKRNDTKMYHIYHDVCLNLKNFFGLNQITNKTLDEFLWLEAQRLNGLL